MRADRNDLRTVAQADVPCQLLGDVTDRGLRIGIEHHVGAGTAERVDDGQTQAHATSPNTPRPLKAVEPLTTADH